MSTAAVLTEPPAFTVLGELPDDAQLEQIGEPPRAPFEKAGFAVKALQWDNRPIRRTRFAFPTPHPSEPRLQEFLNRFGFARVIESGKTEWEQILLLRDWVHRKIPFAQQPVANTIDPFEILDLAGQGGGFYCTHYSTVLQACLAALGWTSRKLSSDTDRTQTENSTQHGVNDVFVNQLGKWVALDPMYNTHYEKAGVPLSPWELCQLYVAENGKGLETKRGLDRTPAGTNQTKANPGHNQACNYFWVSQRGHMDPFTPFGTWYPRQELVLVGDAHKDKIWYMGNAPHLEPQPGYRSYFQFTRRFADVYPDVGCARIELAAGSKPNTVRVELGTLTPNLDAVLIQVDEHVTAQAELGFDWYLHEGENRLRVRTRNRFGRLGHESQVTATLVRNAK
ncbi:MAG TPA: transglutaminase family protein [Planctomycetota bacterium]|nr:transglutaminase family protein [Planctomycetota bacterium]